MPTAELSVTLTASTLSSHTEQSGNIVYSVLGDATLASGALVLLYGSLRTTLDGATVAAAAAVENIAKLDSTLDDIHAETFSAIFGGTKAPYEDVLSWTGHPLTGSRVRVRTGNLYGIFGESNEFGLFAGEGWDESSGAAPLASSKYIRLGSFTNEFHNVPINLYDTGILTMQMEPDAPSFAMGNPIPSTYGTGIGLWQGKDSDDVYKWRVGDPSVGGSMLSWNGSSLSLVNSSLDIGGATAHIAFGNPPPTSPTSGTGIWIDRTGFYGVNAGVTQIFIDTLDGILYIDGGTEFGVNPLLGDLYVDGILTIGTDGRLQQGTGTWGVDFTGSAIWNDSGVMNIGGWNNNVKQWWGGSDGKFYTGGGNVTMDANGIALNSTANYLDPGAALIYRNSGREVYRIAGQNNYQIYHLMTAPAGFGYPLEHRNWINNLNPGALYDLMVTDGNSTYKYGSSTLNIDHSSTNVKSLKLSMKHYDYVTGNRAEGKLYYYSKLGEGYNTVTLSSECQDQTEGTKTASILLRSASYFAEVSSRIDITTDDVNIISNLAITGITTTTGGVHVGGTSDPGTDNLVVDGTIKDGSGVAYLKSTQKAADSDKLDGIDSTGFSLADHIHSTFSTAKFVPLSAPLTSTSWDGDAYSTTAKTKIDLSTVFGVPDGAKGIFVRLVARDSGSSAGYYQLSLSPNNTANSVALQAYLQGIANDVYVSVNGVVPCDANGDVYYQITASGTGTLDAIIEIWGYWIDQTGLPTGLYEDAQVSAYRDNTAFSFTTSGTVYAVPLNQESYDTHSFHSTTANPERFTCTKAGTYLITGQVSFAANATGNRDALVRVNGTDYVGQMRLQAASSGSTSVPATAIVKLNVGDYVELCGRQYSDGSLDTYYANSISNYMTMVLITESPVDAWKDWAPTVTGWAAGYVVNTARYKLIGKTCFFTLDISGTSNSTAVTATMPFTSYSGAGDPVWGGTNAYVQNNGTVATTSASRWYIGENSATLIAHTNMSTGTWTASGTKRIRITGFYEIA